MKNRDTYWRWYKIQETLYMGQWHLSPLQSRHLGTSHSSPSTYCTVQNTAKSCVGTAISSPSYFPELTVWNLFPFKGGFSFGKSQKLQGTKSGLQQGWVTCMIWCFTKKLCTRCDAWAVCCCDEAANHQLSIYMAFWIIRIVSMEECSSIMQNLMQIHCSTFSVILNVTATQHTCSLSGVYWPHWLVRLVHWSRHCSCARIPVPSPWLPGYINVA